MNELGNAERSVSGVCHYIYCCNKGMSQMAGSEDLPLGL